MMNHGEITGKTFTFTELDQGMPMRPSSEYRPKLDDREQLCLGTGSYNPFIDFDLYNTKPNIDVSYNDTLDNSGIGFSGFGEDQKILTNTSDLQGTPRLINDFSIRFLMDFIRSLKSKKPIILSPFSIIQTFNILYHGSKGQTQQEIANAFSFTDRSTTFDSFVRLNDQIEQSGTVKIANCVLFHHKYPLNDAFRQYVSRVVTIDSIDPRNSRETSQKINNYIAHNTNNQIRNLVSPNMFDDLLRVVILNAVFFYSTWVHPFDPNNTRMKRFYSDQDRNQLMMSNSRKKANYCEDNINQVLELDFQGGIAMGFVLPKHSKYPHLTDQQLNNYIGALRQETMANIQIPKFSCDSKFETKNLFKKMGLHHCFSNADLSEMLATHEPVYITNIIHQAKIIVNETGVQASSTSAIMVANSWGVSKDDGINFVANHPFIYYIRHKRTNTIIFTGIYR